LEFKDAIPRSKDFANFLYIWGKISEIARRSFGCTLSTQNVAKYCSNLKIYWVNTKDRKLFRIVKKILPNAWKLGLVNLGKF